jgi:hypothetical protein
MNRILTLAMVALLVASSLVLVGSVSAQSITKPSIPEFTLKLIDYSYDVPSRTTTTTDPYTGKQTVTTHTGYHVENFTIDITVKNQQFNPSSNQNSISLYYNVSYKGHYADEWRYYPSGMYAFDSDVWPRLLPQSSSDYTVISLGGPDEGQMDIRVQAQLGYYDEYEWRFPAPGQPFDVYVFNGELSGWSSSQTISIDSGSASTPSSPNPTVILTPTPSPSAVPTITPTTIPTISSSITFTLPQFGWIEIVAVIALGLVAVLVVVVVVLGRRIRRLECRTAS